MAVEIEITGGGSWVGGKAELGDYSIDEEATPIEGSDTSGAVPGMSFTVVTDPNTLLLYDSQYTLKDESNGTTTGTITGINDNNGLADISGESRLSALVAVKQFKPYNGTLQGALDYYLGECGIVTGIAYDAALQANTRTAVLQGWDGTAWDVIKMLCVAYQFEVSLVGATIMFRTLRIRQANSGTDSSIALSLERGDLAKSIEVIRYENTYRANAMVYPAGGWTEDLEIYSVEANEEIEIEVPVDVSLISIEQPTCVISVPRNYTGPSVYAVAGNEGLPITPAQWTAQGGKVTAEIGEDMKTIVLKVKGPSMTEYSPYTFSMNSGSSNAYSAIRLRGTGVHFSKEVVTFLTGTGSPYASQDVGITIDNPMIQNADQVATIGLSTARRYGNPSRTLTVNAAVLNRKGEQGFISSTTLGDFDAARTDTYTLQSFKTEFAGRTFAQIRDKIRADANVMDRFENQAFGNVNGSIVRYGDAWYRIRRATIAPSGVQYTAEADTTLGQVKTAQAGRTLQDLKTARAGMTLADIALVPLRR